MSFSGNAREAAFLCQKHEDMKSTPHFGDAKLRSIRLPGTTQRRKDYSAKEKLEKEQKFVNLTRKRTMNLLATDFY